MAIVAKTEEDKRNEERNDIRSNTRLRLKMKSCFVNILHDILMQIWRILKSDIHIAQLCCIKNI